MPTVGPFPGTQENANSMKPATTSSSAQAPHQAGLLRFVLLFLAIALPFWGYYAATGKALAFVDIGLDTFSYFYPLQIVQSEQLREYGTLTWSFRLGLGGYIGAVINPIQFAFAWLPDAWQLGARMPMYLIKLLLAGAFFFGYLRRLRFDPSLACIGGLAYAFGNYGVINEQWDALFILQFSAYLYFLESYLRTSRAWFAVAAGVIVCAAGPFELYVFALLSALYVPARTFLVDRSGDSRPLLHNLMMFGLLAALGSLLMAFVQLPNILYLLDSPRVSGDHSKFPALVEQLLSLNRPRTIGAEIAGLFGKDLLGTGSAYRGYQNYFEAPGFYVGILMLACGPQLLSPHASRRERMAFIAAVVLLAGYIVWPAMRYAVYGFGHTGFRISTLWVSAGILVIGLAGLRRASLSGVWRPGVIMAAVAIASGLALVVWKMHAWIKPGYLFFVLAFALLYLGLLWAHAGQRLAPALLAGLCFVVTAELFLAATPAFLERNAVTLDGESSRGRYDDASAGAIALARAHGGSDEFYRMEKTYESVFLNDPLVQGYHGTKSYFFHGPSITRFVDELKLHRRRPRPNYISAMTDRPDLLDLLGVRYLLSRDAAPAEDQANRLIGTVDGIHVYFNSDARGVAHLYRDIADESVLADTRPRRRDPALLRSLLVDDVAAMSAAVARLVSAPAPAARPASEDRVTTRMLSDTALDIRVNATRPAALFVAIPHDRGWQAEVDGRQVATVRAQYGLTALPVPAGESVVELRYSVPGRRAGQWISFGALLTLLALASGHWWWRRSRQ